MELDVTASICIEETSSRILRREEVQTVPVKASVMASSSRITSVVYDTVKCTVQLVAPFLAREIRHSPLGMCGIYGAHAGYST